MQGVNPTTRPRYASLSRWLWLPCVLGAGLLAGGAILATGAVSLGAPAAWPAWLMLSAGLYLVVRR